MAKRKQVGKRVEGWKAKSWFKVYGPEAFGKTYMGDTISADPSKVMGRVMQTRSARSHRTMESSTSKCALR